MKLDRVIAVRNSKTVFRDGDRSVKVFNSEYTKAEVINAALNQAKIEETGLNIPKLLEITMIDGKWAIISEYIKGKTLAQLMKENPSQRGEYLALLVELQCSVHEKKCAVLTKLNDKISRDIFESEVNATVRYDLHTRLENMPKENCVCHGDFIPSNIVIDENGVPYIIDWSHATQGNRAADAAKTYLMFCVDGERELADEYLELFTAKSGTDKEYLKKWIPMVAAAQSIKGNEKERELILSWLCDPSHEW